MARRMQRMTVNMNRMGPTPNSKKPIGFSMQKATVTMSRVVIANKRIGSIMVMGI